MNRSRAKLLKISQWLFIIGVGPLLVAIALDAIGFPGFDNPIGFGLLFITATPAAAVVLIIAMLTPSDKKS